MALTPEAMCMICRSVLTSNSFTVRNPDMHLTGLNEIKMLQDRLVDERGSTRNKTCDVSPIDTFIEHIFVCMHPFSTAWMQQGPKEKPYQPMHSNIRNDCDNPAMDSADRRLRPVPRAASKWHGNCTRFLLSSTFAFHFRLFFDDRTACPEEYIYQYNFFSLVSIWIYQVSAFLNYIIVIEFNEL